jgi:succinylglutamate desuccinylase
MIHVPTALDFFETRHDPAILPYCIETDSGNLGPHIVIFGATHGNEKVGVKASIDYIKHLEKNHIKLKKGKISWIIGNPKAFETGDRFVDFNMNRAYNLELGNSYEEDRVKEIRKYFENSSKSGQIDVVLDLHSVSVGDFKIAICLEYNGNYDKLCTLTTLESRFTCHDHELPGTLMEEAERFGAYGYAVECGNHNDPESDHIALWHINKLLLEYDLLDQSDLLKVDEIPLPNSIIHFKCIDYIKPGPDFVWHLPQDQIKTGGKVKAGHVYASYEGYQHTAPRDCVLFVPDKKPNPTDFDAGFICDLEVSLPEMYY